MIQTLLISAATAAGSLLAGRILLHYFQLESYQHPGYFRTVPRNLLKAILPGICMAALLPGFCMCVLAAVLFNLAGMLFSDYRGHWVMCAAEAAVLVLGGWRIGKRCSDRRPKKAFVYTPRVKRLYAVSFIVMTLAAFPAAGMNGRVLRAGTLVFEPIIFFPLFLPLWIALCGLIAWPIRAAAS